MRFRLAWLAQVALCLAFLCLAFCACKMEHSPSCNERDAGAPVDPGLLAFLSSARSAHHWADEREDAKDLKGALAPLSKLVNGPTPKSKTAELAPEVREVLSDTRARMADLESQLADFDAALTDVTRGLELAREPSYFRGHLFETQGLVQERRAKALKTSDPAAATAAEHLAVAAFEEAMAIQGTVIQNSAPTASTQSPPAGTAGR
ncbi:MAG TPA: hypothetical protein VGI10_07565 [Polyangiaceae bacterium]|jgi:hypothetical protein